MFWLIRKFIELIIACFLELWYLVWFHQLGCAVTVFYVHNEWWDEVQCRWLSCFCFLMCNSACVNVCVIHYYSVLKLLHYYHYWGQSFRVVAVALIECCVIRHACVCRIWFLQCCDVDKFCSCRLRFLQS